MLRPSIQGKNEAGSSSNDTYWTMKQKEEEAKYLKETELRWEELQRIFSNNNDDPCVYENIKPVDEVEKPITSYLELVALIKGAKLTQSQNLKCCMCRSYFTDKDELDEHEEFCSSIRPLRVSNRHLYKYRCPQCGKKLLTKYSVTYHLLHCANDGCVFCDSKSQEKGLCKCRHKRLKQIAQESGLSHMKPTVVLKDVFDGKSANFRSLNVWLHKKDQLFEPKKIHNEKAYKCKYCDWLGFSEESANEHIKLHNVSETPNEKHPKIDGGSHLKCSHCLEIFEANSLDSHMLKHLTKAKNYPIWFHSSEDL